MRKITVYADRPFIISQVQGFVHSVVSYKQHIVDPEIISLSKCIRFDNLYGYDAIVVYELYSSKLGFVPFVERMIRHFKKMYGIKLSVYWND